ARGRLGGSVRDRPVRWCHSTPRSTPRRGSSLAPGTSSSAASSLPTARACSRPSPRRPSSSSSPTCINHAQVRSVPFHGAARLRPIYFGPLVPHLVLAALVVPLPPTPSIGHGIDPLTALPHPAPLAPPPPH